MRGIGGFFDLTGIREPPADRIKAMRHFLTLANRPGGSCGCGVKAGAGGALVWAGLEQSGTMPDQSMESHGPDPSPAESVCFAAESGSFAMAGGVAVIVRGKIYNRGELLERLSRSGSPPSTPCDAEILARSWISGGPGALSDIEGEFAAAVWDRPAGRFALVADLFRTKPLFWTVCGGWLIFASDARAILGGPADRGHIEWPAVRSFLRWGCIPGGAPPLRGVRPLRPGIAAIFERGRLEPEEFEAFTIPDQEELPDGGTNPRSSETGSDTRPNSPAGVDQDRKRSKLSGAGPRRYLSDGRPPGGDPQVSPEDLRARLEVAVAERLQGDRLPGIWLSGGVDSGLLAVLAGRLAGIKIEAFTLGVSGPGYDERPMARLSARAAGIRIGEFEFRIRSLEDLLPAFEAFDVPLADTSVHTTFALARATSGSCRAALSGEGGDELFGGYHEYRLERLAGLLPDWALRAAGTAAGVAARAMRSGDDRFSTGGILRRFASGAFDRDSPHAWRWRAVFSERDISCVFIQGAFGNDRNAPLFEKGADPRETDMRTILPDALLPKADRTGTACGVEIRLPYLAPEVVDLAQRAGFAPGKRLLKAACKGLLPSEVISGRKRGFSAPLRAWLRGAGAGAEVFEYLSGRNSALGDILNRATLEGWMAEHRCRRRDRSREIHALLALESWLRRICAPRGAV